MLSMSISIALDFETADNGPDSACALGMARILDDCIDDVFYSLIRPPRPRMLFTRIHGLRWADVRDAPDFAGVWRAARGFTREADCFVAHNAAFDRHVLYACCAAAGLPVPHVPFICTLRGARKALRLPSHLLPAVCGHLAIELRHHHAGSDALAAARILLHLRGLGLDDASMRLKPFPGTSNPG
jgi:DNA polymerase-3 subunit epsilon